VGAGQDVEVYHCAFDPTRFDAVLIPAIKTAFVKAAYPHSFSISPSQPVKEQYTLALSRYSKVAALKKSNGERTESQERFWFLLGKAVEMIRRAKRNHDKLEQYYIHAMDFGRVAEIQNRITAELMAWAEAQEAMAK